MKKIAIITFATLLSACSIFPQQQPLSGIYAGTLPCADCEKIDAMLTLHQDGSYEYNTVYFKRGKSFPFNEKGKFSRSSDNHRTIRLESSANLTLKITDEYAEFCDEKGNSVNPHEYKLLKIK